MRRIWGGFDQSFFPERILSVRVTASNWTLTISLFFLFPNMVDTRHESMTTWNIFLVIQDLEWNSIRIKQLQLQETWKFNHFAKRNLTKTSANMAGFYWNFAFLLPIFVTKGIQGRIINKHHSPKEMGYPDWAHALTIYTRESKVIP